MDGAPLLPAYELYAIRYAHLAARRSQFYSAVDAHDGPLDVDYFVWVAVGAERSFVVDIGFNQATGDRRHRQRLRCPIESLRLVGLDPAEVRDVVITHLHYDHAGNFKLLPRATFHIQESEAHFVCGHPMRHGIFRHTYEVEDVLDLVRLNFAERVMFHDGRAELAPGLELLPAPGHTPGQQMVRVHTRRGWVCVLSDAAHFFENILSGRPFPGAVDPCRLLDSYDRILALAGGVDRIVPGHDPLVMQMYPPASAELAGVVVRLDCEPDMGPLQGRLTAGDH